MKKILALVLLLAAISLCAGALADEKDLYIDGNAQKIFTSEDGLLSTSTQTVAQTSEGFVWIGGYGGLVRYDGRHFETFAYKRITRVSDLAAGENGELWVATSDKGLFRYVDHEFQAVPDGDGSALGVECLAFSPDGKLYLGVGEGLCTVEDGQVVRLDIPGLNGACVERLLCPRAGLVLCVTKAGGLFAWDGQTAQRAEVPGNYDLRSICYSAGEDAYLVGTSGDEVLVFDGALNYVKDLRMEGLSCINDLHSDASGALWLCADNGIAIYINDSVRMQNLLMDNSVDRMLVDREGNYWFVSSRQGVLEVSRSKFGNVSQSAGLDSMVVNAIQRIGDTLYIGHDAGLVTLHASDFKKTGPVAGLNGTRVRALLAGEDDSLWIGTMKKGLLRYVAGEAVASYTSEQYPQMQSNNVRSITPVEGGVLIGTDVGAYYATDDGIENVAKDAGALAFRILCAARFGDTVYLGSDGNGLYLLQDGGIIRHITTDDGLSSNVIMKEYWSEAYQGVWLVTGNDIDFLDSDGKITSIENFPSTNNLDLLVMQNGDAWVFTGSGIYQTTEDSLLQDSEPRYIQFRHVDGLPYEVTPNAYQCLTDDVLYVCGSGGVFSLQTEFSDYEPGEYQLVVDSVNADGEPIFIKPDEPCQLEADVKRIDINAYVLTYQTGNPFVYHYLEGFDNGETVAQLSDVGDISYTNLNGGSYTFHFGIRDYRTGEVVQEITVPIVKKYAWYENPEVRFVGIVAGLALLALITALIVWKRGQIIEHRLHDEFEEKENIRLREIAYKDYLTGLYNRNYLEEWNARPLPDEAYPVTFVSIDLNNLKIINDLHGHAEGDRLLCAMAELLKKHFAEDCYTVVRTGGDEFLVLARGVKGEQVQETLDCLTREASDAQVDGIPITFGYGMCAQQAGEFDFEEGLRVSDMKLLDSKNRYHGRN